jgi:hypothetical protein
MKKLQQGLAYYNLYFGQVLGNLVGDSDPGRHMPTPDVHTEL